MVVCELIIFSVLEWFLDVGLVMVVDDSIKVIVKLYEDKWKKWGINSFLYIV